jgi:predicted acylesterase/phospholipase RssA
MLRQQHVVALLLIHFGLAACASRPATDLLVMNQQPWGVLQAEPTSHRVDILQKGRSINVLALSGGGANGAFGAGVVYGWMRSNKVDQFDVVSGVSAGGLIAVLAFAGPKYSELLKSNFTNLSINQVANPKLPFGLLGDSLADSKPLRQRIERVVTDDLLREVARNHMSGRRLYVTTTNLDSGQKVIWDMGGIATSQRADRLQRFQDILVASAAIPGFYQPVYLTMNGTSGSARQMHVDGGLKFAVPLAPEMFDHSDRKRNITFMVNGYVEKPDETTVVRANLSNIGSRSVSELSWSQFAAELGNLRLQSILHKDQLVVIAVPPHFKGASSATDFDPQKSNDLFALGLAASE